MRTLVPALVLGLTLAACRGAAPAETSSAVRGSTYALAFDGSPMTVDSGPFWPEQTPLGPFYWIARVRPAANTSQGYVLSDGYGGAHALLFGFRGGRGRLEVTGNVWDGTRIVSFSGGSCAEDVWCEVAVRWDGTTITVQIAKLPTYES